MIVKWLSKPENTTQENLCTKKDLFNINNTINIDKVMVNDVFQIGGKDAAKRPILVELVGITDKKVMIIKPSYKGKNFTLTTTILSKKMASS